MRPTRTSARFDTSGLDFQFNWRSGPGRHRVEERAGRLVGGHRRSTICSKYNTQQRAGLRRSSRTRPPSRRTDSTGTSPSTNLGYTLGGWNVRARVAAPAVGRERGEGHHADHDDPGRRSRTTCSICRPTGRSTARSRCARAWTTCWTRIRPSSATTRGVNNARGTTARRAATTSSARRYYAGVKLEF